MVAGEPTDLLFQGVQGRPLATITYRRAWERARKAALTDEHFRSQLVRRPYDLRHACLSTWLNGGVAATQVAEWAGHSVEMLFRVYAKCLDGQHEIARRRIADVLAVTDDPLRQGEASRAPSSSAAAKPKMTSPE
jgi:integrase